MTGVQTCALPISILQRIDDAGGTLSAIEQGLIQREIQDAAYLAQQAIDSRTAVVVGVNQFATEAETPIEVMRIDADVERQQVERLRAVRGARDESSWRAALDAVGAAARGTDNLVPPIIQAVEARATVGEISDALRAVFGEHKEIDA